MRCPTLAELPPPPPGRVGWPWTVAAEPATTEVALPRVTIVMRERCFSCSVSDTVSDSML